MKKIGHRRAESVADHSYALSLLCLFEGERRGYDVEKLLKLAILHDLEEAITGDLTPQDKENIGKTAVQAERTSAREALLVLFPSSSRKNYRKLWSEMETKTSKEARLVKELDKLEMALQANLYASKSVRANKINDFYESARKLVKDPELKRVLNEVTSKNPSKQTRNRL